MAEPLVIVQKLIALALNNPNEEEARTAAMRACAMIVAENMTIEGRLPQGFSSDGAKPKWKPDAEFDAFWEATKGNHNPDGTEPDGGNAHAQGLKASIQDTDLDDDFMRKRIKLAWRALQRERARFKTWMYEVEVQTQRRYPRPEPKDWETDV